VFDPSGPVLGIDPGLSRCGYGAVRGRGSDCRAVAYGVIRTDPAVELPARLAGLQSELEELVAELAPSALAVERVLFQVNVRTAMSVGQASGLALALAARTGIPVAQYSPNEVKLAVAGHGGAEKAAVQAMVVRLLRLAEPPQPPDAADALALALCHSWGAPLQAAREQAGAPTGRYRAAVDAALSREGAQSGVGTECGRRSDPAGRGAR
jgi:crossover junction endodeoxyribonuclease RuvC